MSRRLVLLLTMGGPESPEKIPRFLRRMFTDPAILNLPAPVRYPLALTITALKRRRSNEIYKAVGHGSPLFSETEDVAKGLQTRLSDTEVQTLYRYGPSDSLNRIEHLCRKNIGELVFLPLYPQFSDATSGSSLKHAKQLVRQSGYNGPIHTLPSYPVCEGFVRPFAEEIESFLFSHPDGRVLYTAHGLPQRRVQKGDPYLEEVQRTVKALRRHLPDHDGRLCFQSCMPPFNWLGPMVKTEIQMAGREKKPVCVVPVSFVSENVETLVELDRDQRNHAIEAGVPVFQRVATPGRSVRFLNALAELVEKRV